MRYFALDNCFRDFNNKYFIEDLVDACNEILGDSTVTERQVYTDIKFMENNDDWDFKLIRHKEGKRCYYRYSEKGYSIKLQPISDKEIDQLRYTTFLLNRFDGRAGYEWAGEMIARLDDKFKLSRQGQSVVILDSNPTAMGLEHISTIYTAITTRQTLHIEYKTFSGKDHSWDVSPYFLREYNNRWFLIALDIIGKSILHIALDRIKTIRNAYFRYIDDTIINDYNRYFENVIGVTIPKDREVEQIKLQFSVHRFPYITAKPIHDTMKIVDAENHIVTIDVIPNKELESLILSYGIDVEVLEPQHLREKIAQIIKISHEKYSGQKSQGTD